MGRILIVEDEQPFAELLAWVFRQEQYQVSVATNATDAIRLGLDAPPDLVLTDWMLDSVRHGGEVVHAIRSVCPWTRAIVMTGHPEIVLEAWIWREDINLVIEKPFHMRSLLTSVRRILHQREFSAESVLCQ